MARKKRSDHVAIRESGDVMSVEAGKLLRISDGSMALMRKIGTGPAWKRVHNRLIAYNRAEIEALANIVTTSGQTGMQVMRQKFVFPAVTRRRGVSVKQAIANAHKELLG